MAQVQNEDPKPGSGRGKMAVLAAIGLVAVLALTAVAFKLYAPDGLSKYATGTLSKMTVLDEPVPMNQTPFTDADGKPMTAADFKGKVVVMNVWATWCAPCKVEMPTLARLQAHYAGKPLLVAAMSVDRDSALDEAKAFIAQNAPLTLFRDANYNLAFALNPKVEGFPTTLIIDAQGREVARVAGEADWDAPEVKALLDRLLSES
jgi:thiol-disulfide isomerase/thioredoxin